jgi:AAA family ATP:ADP antiporter
MLADVRTEERPLVIGAFVTLLGVMAGHTLIETARDTLFLQKLPAEQLPWLYLAIAALAVVLAQAEQRLLYKIGGRFGLSVMMLAGAAMALVFWSLTGSQGQWIFYALYIWSAIFSTLITIHFWTVMGNVYTMSQAKRVYGFIGAGSVIGAIAGAGIARLLTHYFHGDARTLLIAVAAVYVPSAFVPALLLRGATKDEEPREGSLRRRRFTLLENLPLLREDPYLRRVAILVLVSTVSFTIVDYLFKTAAVAHVDHDRLGQFFSTTNLVFNVIALFMQVGAVAWLVRVLGVTRATIVLPILFILGGAGVIAGGGMAAVLLVKGADGGFRHSLHRTTIELLYVPISESMRSRVKALMDGLGQRGGQAIGSLAILGVIAASNDANVVLFLGGFVIVLAAGWIITAAGLTRHYLELFRSTLREGNVDRVALPALDVGSLERLIVALNSEVDAEVLATLDLLADQGRERLIPALILYHPARAVVLRALEIFARSERADFIPPARRLIAHPDAQIRAAALTAITSVEVDVALLRRGLEDKDIVVRATALVHLMSSGALKSDAATTEEATAAVTQIAKEGTPEARLALAHAIRLHPAPVFERVLLDLVDTDEGRDPAVGAEVAQAMGVLGSPSFIPALVAMLGRADTMAEARDALVHIGPAAIPALTTALRDTKLPHKVRRHLPRTISRFAPAIAGPLLLQQLGLEHDSVVRHKILRGLNAVRASDPKGSIDVAKVRAIAEETVRELYRLIDWRMQLAKGAAEEPSRRSPGHQFLRSLIDDKRALALEQLLRLFGLLNPEEDFQNIYRGLRSKNPDVHASSRELLDHLVDPPLRQLVDTLVDDAPDEDRMAAAAPFYVSEPLTYDELLDRLLHSDSESLRCLAAYHVGEIGLEGLRGALLEVPGGGGELASVVERALAMLDARRALRGVSSEVARA